MDEIRELQDAVERAVGVDALRRDEDRDRAAARAAADLGHGAGRVKFVRLRLKEH